MKHKTRITIEQVAAWKPCSDYPPERIRQLFGRRKYFTLAQLMALGIPARDKLWCVLHKEIIPAPQLHLLACRDLVPVLGLSLEPLVGRVVIPPEALRVLDWVIIGSEQLAMHKPGRFADGYENAARLVIQQCAAVDVAVFHKQMPIDGRVSADPAEWPKDVRVRQWPGGNP